MQRRKTGTYEFRKRLPKALAGQPVPAHMREPFSELVNRTSGRFKCELVRSLTTKDPKEAKRRVHRMAARVTELLDAALATFTEGPPQRPHEVDIQAIEDDVSANFSK